MRPRRPDRNVRRHAIAALAVAIGISLVPLIAKAERTNQAGASSVVPPPGVPSEQDPALEAAKRAVRRRNFDQAVKIWREAATRGSTHAQYRLGSAYRSGMGVERNLELALDWLERAARGGSADAQFDLGSLYLSGTGLDPDRAKALEWLGRAARSGNRKAQALLDELGSSNAFALAHARVGAHSADPQRALAQAIRVGDLGSANEALARGAKPNLRHSAADEEAPPLLLAIEKRRSAIVGLLLQHGASPDQQSKLGESALILAIQSRESKIVQQLLEAGASVEMRSPSGTLPLMEAARAGDDVTLAALLAKGANPRQTLPDGTSAADLARRFGHPRLAQRLRAAGSPSLQDADTRDAKRSRLPASGAAGGLPPLIEAARRGDVDRLRSLAQSGIQLDLVDADDDTALHRAAEGGHLDAVRFLLAGGVSADIRGRNDSTPLMRAMASESKQAHRVMEALLDAGADASAVDHDGAGILQYAALGATSEKLELVRKHRGPWSTTAFGAAMESAATKGQTRALAALLESAPTRTRRSSALCAAVSTNQVEALGLLLRGGAPHAGQCADGISPLMLAARQGSEAFVAKLLAAGFVPEQAEDDGDTALIAAAGRGYTSIVRKLLEAGADADHRGTHRMTALQSAAASGQLEVVRLLLEKGADPRLRNDSDERALDLAREAGHSEVAQLIESSRKTGWGGW